MKHRIHFLAIAYQENTQRNLSSLPEQRLSIIILFQKMNNEDVSPIIIPPNYSGALGQKLLTNEDLLKLTNQERIMIHGLTLFALKYRILPCTVNQKLYATLGEHDNAFTFNSISQFLALGRGSQCCSKRKQEGVYHSTRLGSHFRIVLG